MRFAWYGAQSSSRIFAAENKFGLTAIGKALDFRAVVQPNNTSDIGNTPDWLFNSNYLGPLIDGTQSGKRKIWWSIAPFGTDGNWASAAAGAYDSQFTTLMTKMVAVEARNGNHTGPIEFRLAFEFNGNWFWWKAAGHEANFIAAWRRYWNIAQTVAPGRFQFEWAPSETTQLQGTYADPDDCWPGDQYVQKVGLDLYWKPFESWQWGTDPDDAFDEALNSPLGLNWLKNFAAAHGDKPIVLSEWGVQPATSTSSGESVNTEPFIRKFSQWCVANNVEGTLYWNGYSGEGFVGDVITHNNWPVTYNALKTNFVNVANNANPFAWGSGGGGGGDPEDPEEPEEPGGNTGGVIKAYKNDPYDALADINAFTYNKTSLTATQIAQINDWSYGPLVAAGIKTDPTYPVEPLILGDTTAVQNALDAAEAENTALLAQKTALEEQVADLNGQLAAAYAEIEALRAGGSGGGGDGSTPLMLTMSDDPVTISANTLSYGLTAGGFNRMRLPEIRRAIFDDLQARTGQTFDETPDSLTGQFVSVFAEREAAVWELAEATYLSAYPATATGTALDYAVSYAGVTRIQATPSTARAIFFGDQGTLVEVGSIVESTYLPLGASRPARFILESDVLISREAAANVLLTVPGPITTGAVFSVTYNGTTTSHTAVVDDEPEDVAAALRYGLSELGAAASVSGNTVRVTSQSGAFSLSVSANVEITSLGSPGILRAETTGPTVAPANSLTRIITPTPGWSSVTNPAAAVVGTDEETDEDLRARYALGTYRLGAGTPQSIRANLLQRVPGITSASVYENTAGTPDADGRPGHSIEAVVEGGDAEAIARVLYEVKPAGIRAFGTTVITVQDESGYGHSIGLSRPAARPIWIRAALVTTAEEPVPGDVAARAQAAILAAGQALQVGEDVLLQRLAAAVFAATTGVARVTVTATVSSSTPSPSAYVDADIAIGPRQRAAFALERITVT